MGQGQYNLLVCINFRCGQKSIQADLEIKERPIMPKEFHNHLGTEMEILTTSLTIIIYVGFNLQRTF